MLHFRRRSRSWLRPQLLPGLQFEQFSLGFGEAWLVFHPENCYQVRAGSLSTKPHNPYEGVILSGAVFQAEGRISRLSGPRVSQYPRSGRLKLHRQINHPAQAKIIAPREGSRQHFQRVKSANDRFENFLAFDARQRCTEAEVSSVSEGEMAVVFARDVEAVGFGEPFGIAI